MSAETIRKSRLGETVPVDTKGGPINGTILMVNYWCADKNFGFAVDAEGTKHFISANAHRKLRDGKDNPAFGDKDPQNMQRGTDIVAIVHEGEKGLYAGAFCTAHAYDAKATEIAELPLYRVCKSVSFGKGTQPGIQVFETSRDRNELERRYRQIMQDAKGNQGVTAIYQKQNEQGTWVRCKNPFATAVEQKKRPEGTRKAGKNAGTPRTKTATPKPDAKSGGKGNSQPRKGGKKDRKQQAEAKTGQTTALAA